MLFSEFPLPNCWRGSLRGHMNYVLTFTCSLSILLEDSKVSQAFSLSSYILSFVYVIVNDVCLSLYVARLYSSYLASMHVACLHIRRVEHVASLLYHNTHEVNYSETCYCGHLKIRTLRTVGCGPIAILLCINEPLK